jgi:hypothetical protein
LVADGLHARTDGFTSLAVVLGVLGAIGVLAGFPLADPIIGLLITVAIGFVLRGAARDIYRRLMDPVDPEMVEAAEASLRAVPGVQDVESLRLRWIGCRSGTYWSLTWSRNTKSRLAGLNPCSVCSRAMVAPPSPSRPITQVTRSSMPACRQIWLAIRAFAPLGFD